MTVAAGLSATTDGLDIPADYREPENNVEKGKYREGQQEKV
jgi:hypothetical protein